MDGEFVRRCPSCGADNAPNAMRCRCTAMLLGIDITRRETSEPPPDGDAAPAHAAPSSGLPPATPCATPSGPRSARPSQEDAARRCPFPDCGQPNPSGALRCVYCNRELGAAPVPSTPVEATLLTLPSELREPYRVVRQLPATGAEADLLLVEERASKEPRVAKIYRKGVAPKSGVQERIAQIDPRYRLQQYRLGWADGCAFEVMEYCEHGSLRDLLRGGPLEGAVLSELVGQLDRALTAVHAVQLVHRDLKPENVLVRSLHPLELVLIDFGIASVLDATQRFTGTARTLPYAAPESLSGVIDAKADYWALGIMLLEAARGSHPFAGLSEAVILHHLATRSQDVSDVSDPRLRQLLQGLLARDPKQRWGHEEIVRWEARDPTLAAPRDADRAARYREPYRVAGESCHSPPELALALARHWREGAADLRNGQLLTWLRDVERDQDAVRLLLEAQHDARLHIDVQLLKLLVHLAPGVPPVWRGESVELPALIERTNRALRGDESAAQWLADIHEYHVLEEYARAGNVALADVVARWSALVARFESSWARALELLKTDESARDPERIVLFDDVVYGAGGPSHPSRVWIHPRLLALGYDPAWLEHLRRRLLLEVAALYTPCPWLLQLGDPRTLDAPGLLVLEAVLPEARQAAESRARSRSLRDTARAEECRHAATELVSIQARIRARARAQWLSLATCTGLRHDLERFFELLAIQVHSDDTREESFELRRTLKRLEPTAQRLLARLDRLLERREANSGWLDTRTLTFAGLSVLVVPVLLGPRGLYLVLLALAGIGLWRFVPNYFTAREIRSLAARF